MYVDAYHNRKTETIEVVERDENGARQFFSGQAPYRFYYTDPNGSHTSIFGDKLACVVSRSFRDHNAEREKKAARHTIFESDINPVFRYLADRYHGAKAPRLHVAFIDAEVAYDPKRGFANPDDPFNAITAISIRQVWLNQTITLALCPSTLTLLAAQEIGNRFENTLVFDDEAELLVVFNQIIDEADILSSWNGDAYDLPYIVNRERLILGEKATRALCLWNELPKPRVYQNKFKKTIKTYELVGRVHLDLLLLFEKHVTQQQQSYSLNAIGESEVGETKVPYDGTLDDLYKKDFGTFIAYNRQDVDLLAKIDEKRKFIELANQIAHANSVLLKTTMGTVALVEQAITNATHQMGFIVPDRKRELTERDAQDEDDEDGDAADHDAPVVGAYVAKPQHHLVEEIACMDINSLYPTIFRAFNMSPETLYGQLRLDRTDKLIAERVAKLPANKRAEAWEGMFATLEYDLMMTRSSELLHVDFEDGSGGEFTAADLHDVVFAEDSNLCVTANGTIFRTDREGIIPRILSQWYGERKELQAEQARYEDLAETAADAAETSRYRELASFFNQRQQAAKIRLNALYGATLNISMKFYDQRIGQSTTLTGRSIVRHMAAEVNRCVWNEYNHLGKAIVYGDTDSVYFTAKEAWETLPAFSDFVATRENIIALYDGISEMVNQSFPEFADRQFHTGLERGAIIKAGRELVGSKALFIKKKKYAILMYIKEKHRLDVANKPGKLKVMGLDLKRADTPKYMQRFLEQVLMAVLTGASKGSIVDMIKEFRREFAKRPPWEKGTPKKVNGLLGFTERSTNAVGMDLGAISHLKIDRKVAVNMPGHVRAALNWNILRKINRDNYSAEITDGAKIIVCKLRRSELRIHQKPVTAVAYPIDEPHLPAWFKELPFDDDEMENTIIDNKLDNLLGVLKWDLSDTKESMADELFTFATRHDD